MAWLSMSILSAAAMDASEQKGRMPEEREVAMSFTSYDEMFRKATGNIPFPYQDVFATGKDLF